VLTLYPADPNQGSPYGTGTQYSLTPQFKRLASFMGDSTFQSPRRSLLGSVSGKQRTWSYCTCNCYPHSCVGCRPLPILTSILNLVSTGLGLPYLGTPHGSDIQIAYGGVGLTDYLIYFVTNLNPNGGSLPNWPEYTTSSPQMLTFYAGVPTNLTQDTYRAEAISYLTNISISNPL
jgi:acetylcholinesterase